MFAIEIADHFRAAHQLLLPDGSFEPLHDHDWQVLLRVESSRLDAIDTVMDFHDLAAILRHTIEPLAGRNLGETSVAAGGRNPSAERVAQWIAVQVSARLPAEARLSFLRISEAENCWAIYQP